MHIDKLVEMYIDLRAEHKDVEKNEFINALYEKLDDNIEIIPVPSSEKLAIIRTVLDGCTKRIGLYEYVDEGLFKITLDIVMMSKMTNIDFDNNEDDGQDNSHSSLKYDKINLIGLKDYLWVRAHSEMMDFEDFKIGEISTMHEKNAPGAIMEKQRLLVLENAKEGERNDNN